MTQICTNAQRTNITPISAVMEKATMVSTEREAGPTPLPQPGLGAGVTPGVWREKRNGSQGFFGILRIGSS